MYKRSVFLLLSCLLYLAGCMQRYESISIAFNNSILPQDHQASIAIHFAFGQAKDTVLIFPVYNGRIIGAGNGQGFSQILDNAQTIQIFRGNMTDRPSVLPSSESTSALGHIRIDMDSTILYQGRFSLEKNKRADFILEGIGMPKSYVETEALLPLGFDSTFYSIIALNTTKDTCRIIFSTQQQSSNFLQIPPFQRSTLTTFLLVNSRVNKDIGEDISLYLPSISAVLKDSIGQESTVLQRTSQQPLRRSEADFRYQLRGYQFLNNLRLPQADYFIPIRR